MDYPKVALKVVIRGIEGGWASEWLELYFIDANGTEHHRVMKECDVMFDNNWNRIDRIDFPITGYIYAYVIHEYKKQQKTVKEIFLEWDGDDNIRYFIT